MSDGLVHCPGCGSVNLQTNPQCWSCKQNLGVLGPSPAPATPTAPEAKPSAFAEAAGETRKRDHSGRNIALIGIVVVLGLIIYGVASYSATPTRSIPTTLAGETASPPIAGSGWRQVVAFTGGAAKKTEPFIVRGATLRVHWAISQTSDCREIDLDPYIVIGVYRNNEPVELIISGSAEPQGLGYVYHGGGTYYLDLAPVCATYTITVEESS